MARGTVLEKTAAYTRDNQQAARLILADPSKHGGEAALSVRWARRVAQGAAEGRGGFRTPGNQQVERDGARVCVRAKR